MTRIIITGDRNWNCLDIARDTIRRIRARHDLDFVIVHGDATGVDAAFKTICRRVGVKDEPHPARWDELGPSAGPRRNSEMIAAGADYAIAVHRSLERSKGTLDCVRQCWMAGIAVYLIDGRNPTHRIRGV